MSADVSKRSAAEARRQKLLARGKDRLQQITQGPTPKDADAGPAGLHDTKPDDEEGSGFRAGRSHSLVSADQSLTRSQSLPSEVTKPLDNQTDGSATTQQDAEPSVMSSQEPPKSPPPNSLWNTPRAPGREGTRSESSKAFSFSTEEPKLETWSKYSQQPVHITPEPSKSTVQRISWPKAVAAAVQTTHLLRLITAVAFIMLLRIAKSAIYSGKEISKWQQALIHVYDLPPLVLLTVLQLSPIAVSARLYHNSPSSIPLKVWARIAAGTDGTGSSFISIVRRGAMLVAPGLLTSYERMSTARIVGKAILDGTCIFLYAGMLCHFFNDE